MIVPTALVPICKMNGRYLEISTIFVAQQLIHFKRINYGSANDQANALQIFTDFGRQFANTVRFQRMLLLSFLIFARGEM